MERSCWVATPGSQTTSMSRPLSTSKTRPWTGTSLIQGVAADPLDPRAQVRLEVGERKVRQVDGRPRPCGYVAPGAIVLEREHAAAGVLDARRAPEDEDDARVAIAGVVAGEARRRVRGPCAPRTVLPRRAQDIRAAGGTTSSGSPGWPSCSRRPSARCLPRAWSRTNPGGRDRQRGGGSRSLARRRRAGSARNRRSMIATARGRSPRV